MPTHWVPDAEMQQFVPPAPVWPAPGSDADVQIATQATDSGVRRAEDENDHVRIVSHIGADLVVENNINIGTPRGGADMGFSGGANLTHGRQAPRGFNIWEGQAAMPLMHAEMMEDDGAPVLVMSRSGRARAGHNAPMHFGDRIASPESEIDVDYEKQPAPGQPDQVRSWVVTSGQTLRQVLQEWADREGWDLVWATSREYPVQASAVFKGRFLDVASALVRNFSRASPTPHAKFYKGNRVIVITAAGGE